MGCGCGGSSASKTNGPTQYKVTYPDGRQQIYLHEGQANSEVARSGGSLEIIQP